MFEKLGGMMRETLGGAKEKKLDPLPEKAAKLNAEELGWAEMSRQAMAEQINQLIEKFDCEYRIDDNCAVLEKTKFYQELTALITSFNQYQTQLNSRDQPVGLANRLFRVQLATSSLQPKGIPDSIIDRQMRLHFASAKNSVCQLLELDPGEETIIDEKKLRELASELHLQNIQKQNEKTAKGYKM